MNVDGSGQVRLTDPQWEATSPCWLPTVAATNAIPPDWQQITGRNVDFEQLRPSDAISQVAFTLGGKAGIKYLL